MPYTRLVPILALTLVLVNRVTPVLDTRKSEKTLMLSSPNTYRKLLADSRAWMLPCSVESVMVKEPADTDVKSLTLVAEEKYTVLPAATHDRPEKVATSTILSVLTMAVAVAPVPGVPLLSVMTTVTLDAEVYPAPALVMMT